MQIPKTTRIYTVADIHGRADLLAKLLRAIKKDAAPFEAQRRILVTLGDYIDRGSESRQVIEALIHLPLDGFEAKHLKGNHEDLLLAFINDPAEAVLWLSNGGWATLLSYGFSADDLPERVDQLADIREKLITKIPKTHAAFFKSLRMCYQLGDYFFVHAGVRPGVALDQQKPQDLIWIRDKFLNSNDDFGKIVVHGHTISTKPEVKPNRIGLDTGAFYTGVMTCLVLNGSERYFLQVTKNAPTAKRIDIV